MAKDGPPDEELMDAYSHGQETAFLELYGRYEARAFSFLKLSLGKSRSHLAQEIFQKTWLKVHQSRRSFDRKKRFSSWFFTIAMNTLRDEVGQAREKRIHENIDNAVLVSSEPLADELFSRAQNLEKLSHCLGRLPDRQREIVLLIDLEGFSSQEASKMLALSDSAVRQLLFRARKGLRELFSTEES